MFNEFPYTSFEKINLDWLLDLGKKLKEAAESGEFDGFSPTIEVTPIPGGYRLTITDKNGTKTVDITVGQGGVIVDNSLSTESINPVQNRVITIALNTKYEKPSTGIPASDLSESVQSSLNKADTALQAAPVTSVNGQTGNVTVPVLTVDSSLSTKSIHPVQNRVITIALNTKYEKPSTGIPASDLSESVQSSLNKADTALQAAPVTSVNEQTGDVTIPTPRLDYDTLINNAGVSSGTITLYNNRNLDDYKFLVAEWIVSGNIRASAFFRRADLLNGYLEMCYVDSQNTQRWADITRVSDTSIKLSASSNASGSMYLFGLKLDNEG